MFLFFKLSCIDIKVPKCRTNINIKRCMATFYTTHVTESFIPFRMSHYRKKDDNRSTFDSLIKTVIRIYRAYTA